MRKKRDWMVSHSDDKYLHQRLLPEIRQFFEPEQ